MELWEYVCENEQCGYKKRLLQGTHMTNQTLTDLNEDFANYRIFHCSEGKELYSIDTHDREFDNQCPIHHIELQELDELPEHCPKCGRKTHSTEKEMVETTKGE